VVLAGANVRDDKLLRATLDAVVLERPSPTKEAPQHLCLDKGYDNQPTRELLEEYDYVAHIRGIGEEKLDETKTPSAIRLVDGSSNEHWAGSPNVGRSWCATRRRRPTTWGL